MKTTMKESSSTALLALSALFLAPGMLILSPDGRLFCLLLAGLASAIPEEENRRVHRSSPCRRPGDSGLVGVPRALRCLEKACLAAAGTE
jgi:hypothetical protein